MSFILQLPKAVLESRKILLVPQQTTRDSIIQAIPKYFASGPKIFDCFIPMIGKEGELLLSPFLGHIGASTFLEQLFLQSKININTYFFGTCGAFSNINLELGSIINPDTFFIEEKLNDIIRISSGSDQLSVLSTSFLSSESQSKLHSFRDELGINLIDMEVSFIKRICDQHSKSLNPCLIVTDIWGSTSNNPTPKTLKSLKSYNQFIDLINQACKS